MKEIHDYIAIDNAESAKIVIGEIFTKVEILERFPQTGFRYHRFPERNIRILVYGHYRIAYLLHSDQNIDILGVFHAALDMDRYLFKG